MNRSLNSIQHCLIEFEALGEEFSISGALVSRQGVRRVFNTKELPSKYDDMVGQAVMVNVGGYEIEAYFTKEFLPSESYYNLKFKELNNVDMYEITYLSDGHKIQSFAAIPKKEGALLIPQFSMAFQNQILLIFRIV